MNALINNTRIKSNNKMVLNHNFNTFEQLFWKLAKLQPINVSSLDPTASLNSSDTSTRRSRQ